MHIHELLESSYSHESKSGVLGRANKFASRSDDLNKGCDVLCTLVNLIGSPSCHSPQQSVKA